ncbi:MAG: cysteine--tRNA ligase [Rhodobacteraceae bacterium CG17_big_fil_post_rev_8_21_14_2_50_63_15]|nr:cysteine--tRNA ligase [Roseovarius sp.]PIV78639.1 MAG: cysteine--tRNA ligase [Rhodobacteraceae bacterium CG17_big_fil_post_rev_8_21_14_2_50_63_15]
MTTIRLHNTRTRRKEDFAPLDMDNVRMYVCGPTVYDRAHLGNARPVVVFDVLYRLLRHVYGEGHVTYVRNFTDVDDKINARAAESGRSIGEITAETTQWFLEDMAALGALEPDHMPRATQYIPQMVAMIEGLIAKGHAYEAEGHVLFAVDSWREHYGKLSGRTVEDMIAGARVEVAPYKRNPMDFVLWKPSSEDLPGWPSPWGRGRPGWHIECSAMSYELLGASFDIHGGGGDLIFPHHENEIAQSCCAHPEGQFAKVWLHNEMLQVEGKKMSKSLGNFFTVRDLLDGNWSGGWKVPGEVIRFVFLSTHYRKPMDWTAEKAREAERELDSWVNTLSVDPEVLEKATAGEGQPERSIVEALSDDLNTSLALMHLRKMASFVDNGSEFLNSDDAAQVSHRLNFCASAKLLGFDLVPLSTTRRKQGLSLVSYEIRLSEARAEASKTKDFSVVDALKSGLLDAGVEVRMRKDSVDLVPGPDFDPAKLEALK